MKARSPAVAFALLLASLAMAQGAGTKAFQAIAFAPGQSTTMVEGAASTPRTVGTDRTDEGGQTYVLHAKAGQRLAMRIDSYGRHVLFSIIRPSPAMSRIDFVDKAAGVTEWTGRLAQTGDYVVNVFTRADAPDPHYRLHVTLR